MFELAQKALLFITLGQHFTIGFNQHRWDRSLEVDEDSLYEPRTLNPGVIRELFNEIDTTGDRHISFDEFREKSPNRPEHEAKILFEKADRNHDGLINFDEFWQAIQEWPGSLIKILKMADRNHDNRIDSKELLWWRPRSLEKIDEESFNKPRRLDPRRLVFYEVDRDGDGHLSFDEIRREWPRSLYKTFKMADRNHDNFIDFKEFMQFWWISRSLEKIDEEKLAFGGPMGFSMIFNGIDNDGDERLSYEEFKGKRWLFWPGRLTQPELRRRFKNADHNDDGYFDLSEFISIAG